MAAEKDQAGHQATTGHQAATDPDPMPYHRTDFYTEVMKLTRSGMRKTDALLAVRREKPELFERMIEQVNR